MTDKQGATANAACEPICSKCGGTDIYTRWRKKGQRLSDIWWHDENREYAADECLFRVCRACGYRWTDKIWEHIAPARVQPVQAEESERASITLFDVLMALSLEYTTESERWRIYKGDEPGCGSAFIEAVMLRLERIAAHRSQQKGAE